MTNVLTNVTTYARLVGMTEKDNELHEPVDAQPGSADDYRRCGTCGVDLYSIAVCPDAPLASCGCPEYAVRRGEHFGCDA